MLESEPNGSRRAELRRFLMGHLASATSVMTAAMAQRRADQTPRLLDEIIRQPRIATRRDSDLDGAFAGDTMRSPRRRSGCAGGCDDWSGFAMLAAARSASNSGRTRCPGRPRQQVNA